MCPTHIPTACPYDICAFLKNKQGATNARTNISVQEYEKCRVWKGYRANNDNTIRGKTKARNSRPRDSIYQYDMSVCFLGMYINININRSDRRRSSHAARCRMAIKIIGNRKPGICARGIRGKPFAMWPCLYLSVIPPKYTIYNTNGGEERHQRPRFVYSTRKLSTLKNIMAATVGALENMMYFAPRDTETNTNKKHTSVTRYQVHVSWAKL